LSWNHQIISQQSDGQKVQLYVLKFLINVLKNMYNFFDFKIFPIDQKPEADTAAGDIVLKVLFNAINFREIPIIEMPTEDNTIIRPNSNRVNETLIFPKNSFSLHLINLLKNVNKLHTQ